MYLPKGGTIPTHQLDDAFTKIAEHLNALESPHDAVFITSGLPVMKLHFFTSYLQRSLHNNMPIAPTCAMKHQAVRCGQLSYLARDVKLDDFYDTDLIVIIGHNRAPMLPYDERPGKGKKERRKDHRYVILPEAA